MATFNGRADISPDGRYLALVNRQRGQQYQIAVQDMNNGIMNVLTQTPRWTKALVFRPMVCRWSMPAAKANMVNWASCH
jgi:hypothetical protein